jgi:GWxTD domain-containing protein
MKCLFFLLIFIFTCNYYSQDKFEFEFDYAQFSYDSASNYVEFYYAFNQASLSRIQTDSLINVKGILHITIQDSATGALEVDKDWLISHAITDTSTADKSLIGVISFILEEGKYKCELSGRDFENPERNRVITEYLVINPFLKMGMAMGDIQLASNIIQGSEKTSSIFYKNTFEVLPIPTTTFGENQPVLFYYTELYNLRGVKSDNKLRVDQYVINSRGQVVNRKSKEINRSLNSLVEVGTLMAYKLPTDAYTLVLSLIDSVNNYGVSSSKKFFVYNPSVEYVDTFQVKGSSFVTGMFGVMSEEELDDFFEKSMFISSAAEIDKYESLSDEGPKRKFLTEFWDARDNNPDDGKNQELVDYLKRLEISNERFRAMSKEGWTTDRGRVYLIYGEPSEIDRYPNETETRPYEIWHYNEIEGGVQFVFGDVTGFSEYILLHSTKRGELRDDGWLRRIAVIR